MDEAGTLGEPMLTSAPKVVEDPEQDAAQAAEDRKSLFLSLLTMAISIPALIGA